MPTRRLAATAALLSLGLTTSAAAATPDKCKLSGSKVLAQQGAVRVLQRGAIAKGGDYYACYGKGRPLFVFDGASNEDALGFTLAGGRYLAFVDRRIAPSDGIPDVDLEVYDVKARKHRRTALDENVGGDLDTDMGVTYGGPVQLALTPTGVAAVFDQDRLLVSSPTKAAVVVAYSNKITEVAASAGTIYWTQDGVLKSTSASSPVAAPKPAPSTPATGTTGTSGTTGPTPVSPGPPPTA